MSDIDNLMETASEYKEQSFQVHQASGDESDKNDLLSGIVIKVEKDDLLPLDDAGLQTSDSSDVRDYKEEIKTPKNEEFVHKALLTNDTNARFGAWEEHTRGIGSKLMARMGYVPGTGLGKKSDGIISPCKALVFPAGRSLDDCFTLKKNAGGDTDLLNVERKLLNQNLKLFKKARKQNKQFERKMQKQKKKLEQQKRKGHLREEQREKNNGFDCMNAALESKSNESELSSLELYTELERVSEEDLKNYQRMFQDWRNNSPN